MGLTASRCARCGTPGCDCFLGEPYCEATPLTQGCVVRRPIRQPVPLLGDMVTASGIGLERHGRCPRSGRGCFSYGTCLQAPNGSFLQQSEATANSVQTTSDMTDAGRLVTMVNCTRSARIVARAKLSEAALR